MRNAPGYDRGALLGFTTQQWRSGFGFAFVEVEPDEASLKSRK